MKKTLLASALINASLTAMADGTVTYGDWTFNYDGTTANASITEVKTKGSADLDMTSNAEGVTVTAIRANALDDCSSLLNLTLPASLKQFEEDPTLFEGQFIGQTGTGKHLDCGTFNANPDITVEVEVTSGTATEGYGAWGSTIFTFGSNAFPDVKADGGTVQLYWTGSLHGMGAGKLLVAVKNSFGGDITSTDVVTAPFSVSLHISNGNVEVTATNADGSAISFDGYGDTVKLEGYTINAFDQFSYGMGTNMDADVTITNNELRRQSPSFANTALQSIKVADGNTYMATRGNGTIYYTDDNAVAYKPLTDVGACFTIANADNAYFYANTQRDAQGVLNTTGDNERRVRAAEMSNSILAATLFRIGSTTASGYKIASVNSDGLEFGGKAGGHSNLDVCVSQWSSGYYTTYLGEDTYMLTTNSGYTLTGTAGSIVTMESNADSGQTKYHLTIKAAETMPAQLNASGYAALCLPVAVNAPEGSAYTITENNATKATITPVSGIIAANTPFVLKGDESSTIDLPVANAASAADAPASMLSGYTTRVVGLTAGSFYTLDGNSYVKSDATTLDAGMAYLPLSNLEAQDTLTDTLELTKESTAITEMNAPAAGTATIHDLMGRRIAKPMRGINIINGKKTLVR